MADTTSHNRMRDFQTKASLRWDSIRPYASALMIGLIAGPILTMALGLQVLESTADKRSDEAAAAIQAQICAAQARTAEPMAADLNWQSRAELAERWAVMPGSSQAAPGVASACSNILAARA